MERIIYTANFGGYDRILPVHDGLRRICFADDKFLCPGWEVIVLPYSEKIYRDIKCRPHEYLPPHTHSVWMDANIYGTPVHREGLWVMDHPDRKTIAQEAEACIRLKKDYASTVIRQVRGYPPLEVVATGVVYRNNDLLTTTFNELWWREVRDGSVRDQLSFTFAARCVKINYNKFAFLQGFSKVKHYIRRHEQMGHN